MARTHHATCSDPNKLYMIPVRHYEVFRSRFEPWSLSKVIRNGSFWVCEDYGRIVRLWLRNWFRSWPISEEAFERLVFMESRLSIPLDPVVLKKKWTISTKLNWQGSLKHCDASGSHHNLLLHNQVPLNHLSISPSHPLILTSNEPQNKWLRFTQTAKYEWGQ